MGSYGRVWGHVAGGGGMSQGIGAYGRGWGRDMWQGVGLCGRVLGHVAGCGGIWQGQMYVVG